MNMRAAFDDTLTLAESSDRMPLDGPLGLIHLRDMRLRIEPSFSDAKLGRWLGWAQCAVVAAGAATLDDMKTINQRHA